MTEPQAPQATFTLREFFVKRCTGTESKTVRSLTRITKGALIFRRSAERVTLDGIVVLLCAREWTSSLSLTMVWRLESLESRLLVRFES